jgi:hypothetical protein
MPRDRDDDDDDRPVRRRRDDDDDRPRRRRDEDDYDERPRRRRRDEGDATGGLIPYKNGKALAAYYCGVFGFVACVLGLGIFGIVPIILGFLGLKHAREYPESRGQAHAVTGIVLGLIQVLCFVAAIVYVIVVIAAKK